MAVKREIGTLALVLALFLPAAGGPAAEKPQPTRDPLTGMIVAEDWELTRNNCIVCHSPQQFLRQRGNRVTWQSVVDWMQTSHGMWPLAPEVKEKIVSYLAENYAPEGGNHRRAPILPSLLPPNPYPSEALREYQKLRAEGAVVAPPAP